MTDTFERLTAILIKEYKLSADKLTPEAPLEELGIDSLGTVELLWSVEDAFRIKLPTEPAPLTTLGDVAAYVDQLIAEQAAAATPEDTAAGGPAAAPSAAPSEAPSTAPATATTTPDAPAA